MKLFSYRRVGLGVALVVCVASYCAGPSTNQAAPSQTQEAPGLPLVPDGFVLRPTFDTTLGKFTAGTAFSIKLPGFNRPIVLTAIHLLGPDGGLPQEVPAKEVPQVVKEVTLQDCFDSSIGIGKAGEPIVIPDAAPYYKAGKAGDILAFWGPDSAALHPGRLATVSPAKGERVWLAASLLEGAPPSQRLHAAIIVGINKNGDLVYRFENPKLVIQATSGAPVLNAASEVVAINWGGGSAPNGMFGCGNPVERFAPRLEAAVKQTGSKSF